MRLRRAPDDTAAVDLRGRFLDRESSAHQVDVPHPQGRKLRPAQAAEREDEYGDATLAGSVRERLDLVGGQYLRRA